MPKGTPIDSCPVVWHGLIVGGWPMMVRDGCGAQKFIWHGSYEDKNSLINHAKGTPIDSCPVV
jgi:hypothetical protein